MTSLHGQAFMMLSPRISRSPFLSPSSSVCVGKGVISVQFFLSPFFLYWKIILLIWAGSKLELLWSDKRELGRAGGTISSEGRFGWTEQNFQSLPVSLTFYSYNPQRIKKRKYNSVLWNCVSCTDSAFDTSMVRPNLDLSFGREDNPTGYLFNLIYQYNNQLVTWLG